MPIILGASDPTRQAASGLGHAHAPAEIAFFIEFQRPTERSRRSVKQSGYIRKLTRVRPEVTCSCRAATLSFLASGSYQSEMVSWNQRNTKRLR